MLSSKEGIPVFLDNLVVLSAARFGAPLDDGEDSRWEMVANVLSLMASHPQTEEERKALCFVDTAAFTPAICFHRVQYLQWRAAKAAETKALKGPKPSGFNITKDSIARDIQVLMDNVRQNLPSTMGADEADSGDDDTALEIKTFQHKTAEEVERDAAVAEAEDDFFQKIQEMQLEFFRKHRKWIDVPLNDITNGATSKTSGGALSSPSKSSVDQKLTDMTVADVADVLDELDIADFKPQFRRTTGSLLAKLGRDELAGRFEGDSEALDIFWTWLKEKLPETANSSGRELRAAVDALRAPSAGLRESTKRLHDFQAIQGSDSTEDPLAAMKRALNPSRPMRPSEDPTYGEAGFDASDETSLNAAFMSAVNRAQAGIPAKSEPTTTQHLRGNAAPAATAVPSSQAPPRESAPPSRANRWAIQEYDDDDDDE